MKKTPLEYVIDKFNGQKELQEALGVYWTVPYNWKYRGGKIPGNQVRPILEAAKARGIKLNPRRVLGLE